MCSKRQLSSDSISTVLTAVIFAIAGAVPIFSAMGVSAGLTVRESASLIMCGMFCSGVMSIYLSKKFHLPIYAAPSITAVAVVGSLLKEISLQEMVFGYLAAGIILIVLGGFRLVGKLMHYVPSPIVLAMVAGVYMSYGLNLVKGVQEVPLAGGIIVGVYFLIHFVSKKVPPQAGALIAAILVTILSLDGKPEPGEAMALDWSSPVFILPDIRLDVLIYVSLPLVIMAVSDMFKGYGVLKANGFDVPLDRLTMFCGGASILTSFGLGHNQSLAGPAIAILAGKDAGEKESRYIGSMIFCGITSVVVIMAGMVIGLVSCLSTAVIDIICGLAMIGLLTSSLQTAFGQRKFELGALTSFVIGLSHITIAGIGAPVWAIVGGVLVSLLAEREDFSQMGRAEG